MREHKEQLMRRRPQEGKEEPFARANGTERRVLFIDDTVPLRQFGSGFVRSNDFDPGDGDTRIWRHRLSD